MGRAESMAVIPGEREASWREAEVAWRAMVGASFLVGRGVWRENGERKAVDGGAERTETARRVEDGRGNLMVVVLGRGI